ncbi:hypothetical protein PCASD_17258 [Puccinia coronata f. sp. avenae]|uniref:Uncharacterized protein n=1 Tax=Puccinia coronata f. sp. avenae TaxID=200324 RepID=A0A2N5U9A5_9BASI|nr:hypothetical protein PCASD_17258 [Puccinia coronata f. sp. avenae]
MELEGRSTTQAFISPYSAKPSGLSSIISFGTFAEALEWLIVASTRFRSPSGVYPSNAGRGLINTQMVKPNGTQRRDGIDLSP